MKIGVVGNGADKFTATGAARARAIIQSVLSVPFITAVVSGHSPLGGVDIWAEEIATALSVPAIIHAPKVQVWAGRGGYKARNLAIARSSDIVVVVVADRLPDGYAGKRFGHCYHCAMLGRSSRDHVKSGACWTAAKALKAGKPARWVVVKNGE